MPCVISGKDHNKKLGPVRKVHTPKRKNWKWVSV